MGSGAYTPNNTMHFPRSVRDCLDFSTCNGGRFIGWFVHELTHTWQFQSGRSPFWGHIFSLDLFSFNNYLSKEQYYKTPNPACLSMEKQADWHMWRYLCTNRSIDAPEPDTLAGLDAEQQAAVVRIGDV